MAGYLSIYCLVTLQVGNPWRVYGIILRLLVDWRSVQMQLKRRRLRTKEDWVSVAELVSTSAHDLPGVLHQP